MATEVGTAYVRLIPTMKGFSSQAEGQLSGTLGPAAEKAGDDAGKRGGGRFSRAFKGAFTRLAAGAALFGGAQFIAQAFSDALDRAALPAQLQAQFGLTEQVSQQAAETAGQLYADGWGQSLGEVGQSVAAVQRTLQKLGTGEDVQRVSTQAQALADTFGEEVNPLVTAASQLVKTGLAPSMQGAFDVMTRGFQKGANSGQDFLDTLTEYGTQFRKLGLDGTVAIGLINQGLAAGARNSDLVADAIKEFSIRAVDGSKLTAEGFASIGLDAEAMAAKIARGGDSAAGGLQQVLDGLRNIKDPVAQSQAAVALFGTQAEDLGAALFALNPATVSATGGMNNVQGAAQNVTDTVGGTMQASLTALTRQFQTGLGSALTTVAPLLQGLLTVIQPLLPILGPMAVAIGLITAAQWAWNAALAANPIVLIVGLIAGLVAAFIVLWNKSAAFRDFWIGVWNWIKNAVSVVWNWIKKNWPLLLGILTGPIGWAVTFIIKNWDNIKSAASSVVKWIRDRWNWLKSVLGGIVNGIKGFLGGIWDGVTAGAKAAVNGAIAIINGAIGGINVLIDGANHLPGVNIPHVPTISYLAQGGVVTGPTLAMVGEGGEAEAVLPLSKLDAMLTAASAAPAAAQKIVIDGRGLPRALKEWLQYAVRTTGAGSVQDAFGTA